MKTISLLIYEDAILSSIASVMDIFNGANRYCAQAGKEPAFKLELIGEKMKNIQLQSPAQFICYKTIDEVTQTDLIMAPAFQGTPDHVLPKNKGLVDWIRDMHAGGTEVASLCLGSYFLAEAGLLSGKSCTSHWQALDDMRTRYPDINVLADKVMTDQEGLYTSGGAFVSLNLVLYLIEKFCGRDASIWVSKMFSIDMDRVNQSHFAVFQGQRRHEDQDILKTQVYIEQHFDEQLSIDQLAAMANMSKRNYIRRFKQATQNTPLEYLQRVKIEAAKKELEKNSQNITTLMFNAGYNDVKTFRQVFKRFTGLTPQEYRKKYSRAATDTSSSSKKWGTLHGRMQ
ncbi:AraC family transcriptional regulator with amidase-like domain [Chitinophaga polysaccharea]|uniref:AraC family transcriptional regulator with amidase-like domain n=1 Tax=Chitinophaga polysaccharea TaxID=1293035 RepID=A0A561P6U4_9BACT|nr:helix-turn-helix domain-containing protein [Chitinophaga polysaccharea]TWF33826.1 AraC family transcriptional regulator with amidase-like domain [Chitinophaga polysaccharea]